MGWLIKRNQELSGQRASAPPTAPKSQMKKSPSVGRGGAVNSESLVQIDRGHQHYQGRGGSQKSGTATSRAPRPSVRRPNKSKLVTIAMHCPDPLQNRIATSAGAISR